jgi:hypothetical protein
MEKIIEKTDLLTKLIARLGKVAGQAAYNKIMRFINK